MTRQEFLDRRAVADYLKTHAVTHVAPAIEVEPASVGRRIVAPRRNRWARVTRKLERHPRDGESGMPVPIRTPRPW